MRRQPTTSCLQRPQTPTVLFPPPVCRFSGISLFSGFAWRFIRAVLECLDVFCSLFLAIGFCLSFLPLLESFFEKSLLWFSRIDIFVLAMFKLTSLGAVCLGAASRILKSKIEEKAVSAAAAAVVGIGLFLAPMEKAQAQTGMPEVTDFCVISNAASDYELSRGYFALCHNLQNISAKLVFAGAALDSADFDHLLLLQKFGGSAGGVLAGLGHSCCLADGDNAIAEHYTGNGVLGGGEFQVVNDHGHDHLPAWGYRVFGGLMFSVFGNQDSGLG